VSVDPVATAPLTVRIKHLSPLAEKMTPCAATIGSAGGDVCACMEDAVTIPPGGRAKISTGLAMEIEQPGVCAMVLSRSGLGAKKGLTVAQGVGLIDPDYRGEIMVWLLNTSGEERIVEPGERVAQLLFVPYYPARLIAADDLSDTDRGSGGFGHTGSF
jgi:dUTP pyrophosphatase